jgi:hypothetical protein
LVSPCSVPIPGKLPGKLAGQEIKKMMPHFGIPREKLLDEAI